MAPRAPAIGGPFLAKLVVRNEAEWGDWQSPQYTSVSFSNISSILAVLSVSNDQLRVAELLGHTFGSLKPANARKG